MILILILFFVSLAGIILMIGKKLILEKVVLENIAIQKTILDIPRLGKIKDISIKRIKKYSFVLLVITIRYYVKSSNFLKKHSKSMIQKVKTRLIHKNNLSENSKKQEVSGFLRLISDYKQKVKRIKKIINEEENENLE